MLHWFGNLNLRNFGPAARIVHLDHISIGRKALERDVRHSRDDIHIELTVKAFLHDFHVQQTQETARDTRNC